jgi:hypothetical protein
MKTLIDLLDDEYLQSLARPADFRLGREIAKKGGVTLIESGPYEATAKVQPPGGQKRTVVLTATPRGLECRCT